MTLAKQVMAMNNIEYWVERSTQRLLSAEEKALRLEKKLKKQFSRAFKNIEAEIAKLYYEFAEEGVLDYGAVRVQLTKAQKKQFRKDLEYFIENTTDPDFQKKLAALYKRARITKLEAIKASIEFEVHNLYVEYLDSELQLTLSDILDENYYRTIFDIQQFQGYGVSFTRLSPFLLQSLLEYPWSGKNYSEKLWGHVRDFSGKLENVLTAGIIQGKSNQAMASELAKAANAEYKNAIRLIRTETNFIANSGTAQAYTDYGVQKYKFLATLDFKTSEICRGLDGKVFLLTEKKVGANYPPMHPHCRSTTVPDFDDLTGTRIARKSDGSSYYVDRNMKYSDWYDQYVKSDPSALAAEKSVRNQAADRKQFENYKAVLGKRAPKSLDDFQNLKYNNGDEWIDLKARYRAINHIRDRQNKTVLIGKQNKHIEGTNEFGQYTKAFKDKGEFGPSRISIPPDEVQKLIDRYAGTGMLNVKKGKWTGTEIITENRKIIGTVVNNINGKATETSVFKIHYSSKGVHIVPDYPGKGVDTDADL